MLFCLDAVAYFVRDWQALQLSISIPSLALLSYYWFIPESPRWLISVNRYRDSKDDIRNRHSCRMNIFR